MRKRIKREDERTEALEYALQRANGAVAAVGGGGSSRMILMPYTERSITEHVTKNGAKGRDSDIGKSLLDVQFEVMRIS